MVKFNNASFPLVETVDNYQGEENDIIILSLTRSQSSNGVGFLGVRSQFIKNTVPISHNC